MRLELDVVEIVEAKGHFQKYKLRGPYHWEALKRSLRSCDLFTLARYGVIQRFAGVTIGERVCDLGCGDGALTYLLWSQARGAIVTGVEPEPTGRELARAMCEERHAKITFLESTTSLMDSSQDIVICAEVIEHVEDPSRLLAEIHRILRPGGRAIISTPVRLTEKPWNLEHVGEFFPSQFCDLVSNWLTVKDRRFSTSAMWAELYNVHPRSTFGRPFFKYFANFIYLVTGINLLDSYNPLNRLWVTQTLLCEKAL